MAGLSSTFQKRCFPTLQETAIVFFVFVAGKRRFPSPFQGGIYLSSTRVSGILGYPYTPCLVGDDLERLILCPLFPSARIQTHPPHAGYLVLARESQGFMNTK